MVTRLIEVEAAIHGQESRAGRPLHASPGSTIAALATIWAVISARGSVTASTAAFQPACSSALIRAAATCQLSMRACQPTVPRPVAAPACEPR